MYNNKMYKCVYYRYLKCARSARKIGFTKFQITDKIPWFFQVDFSKFHGFPRFWGFFQIPWFFQVWKRFFSFSRFPWFFQRLETLINTWQLRLKANWPHPRDYPHTPTYLRPRSQVKRFRTGEHTQTQQTNKQTGGRTLPIALSPRFAHAQNVLTSLCNNKI